MGLNRWAIQTLILSSLVGIYIFYGYSVVDALAQQWGISPSSYLYAAGAVFVIIVAQLIGKLLTRGLNT
jgi:hypothetical protein